MADPTYVLSDLRDESEDLDGRVAGLADSDWAMATPATGAGREPGEGQAL